MNCLFRNFVLLSWNVRGLGQDDKCVVVRDNIFKHHPHIVCLQEIKLGVLPDWSYRSFLPANLDAFHSVPVVDSRGGLITAWCSNLFSATSSSSSSCTSTVVLQSNSSDLQFAVTNVYGPSDHSLTD